MRRPRVTGRRRWRRDSKELAELFNTAVPDCADKTAAMRKLRETVMAMNLAVACYVAPQAPLGSGGTGPGPEVSQQDEPAKSNVAKKAEAGE